jgi:hypothetical protein
MEEKVINKTKPKRKPSDEKVIENIHQALETWSVTVYNGQEQPVKKPLGKALTTISEEVRNLKTISTDNNNNIKNIKSAVDNHSELLKDIKDKKEFVGSFKNFLDKTDKYFNLRPKWRTAVKIGGAVLALNGLFSLVKMIASAIGK